MTNRFVTIGTDCNGRFNAYESDGTRIPLNRTGYASQDRTVAALRRFYVVAPGATPRVTLGGWILSGMAHPDRAIAPRDEAFVNRMIDHDIACEEKARARSDAALAAIEAERREPVHVEVRTLAGDMVRRHGPFDRSSPAFSDAYHSEMSASLGHNRMRRHDDESCQRVHIVPAPAMVPQQVQQQQGRAVAVEVVQLGRLFPRSMVRATGPAGECIIPYDFGKSRAENLSAGREALRIRMVPQQAQQQQANASGAARPNVTMQWAVEAVRAKPFGHGHANRGECHRDEACGVRLIQDGIDSFTVVYGKQVKRGLSYSAAAAEYGQCIMHALACDAMLDNRERRGR